MSYHRTKQKLVGELSQLRQSLESYSLSCDASPLYIARQRKLIHSIESFISAADHEVGIVKEIQDNEWLLNYLFTKSRQDEEKIKKLSLLVALSGISFPTIQQPLSLLHQMYQYKRGDADAFTNASPISTIELPGI